MVKIFIVSIVLTGIFASPFVCSAIKGTAPIPRPELPAGMKECAKPAAEMRANHMLLLYDWRDGVVRRGERGPVIIGGIQYQKSLTGSCMKCHQSKEKFCDRCHLPLSVAPACWDCHIYAREPKG